MSVYSEHRKVYKAWESMRLRCNNPNTSNYLRYGGRGIKVCDRWQHSVDNFFADMGEPPTPKHQLDRIDNEGDYSPENCRWVLPKENCRNRSNNTYLTLGGDTLTIAEWSEKIGIRQGTIIERLRRGGSVEKALQPSLVMNRAKSILMIKDCFVFSFNSINEAAKELSITKSLITTALAKGTKVYGFKVERF